jgi:predicted nucleic acid-binding protein
VICVDASVAVKWVLEEPHSERAEALLVAATTERHAIIAPPLLPYEVTNILRKRMLRDGLALADADRLLAAFLSLRLTYRQPRNLHRTALALADAYSFRATYDAHYLGLAQQHRCNLWTDDQRLLGALAGQLAFVRWIGDFQSEL